ncbi:BlaI/MecI/CopY family transcriptional regulator [Flavobacteriaceae bacterium 3-367]|uniref:BlaI/MecI/CopY family transcriptional regulator n=1 Tax=Eudoraea algarum TaxID=3417568 RepID=UPI0032754AB3
MNKLANREEQIMQIVWRLKTVFIRDIIEELPAPKPHYNTVATIVKILVKKGFLKSEMLGNTHQYSPAIDFEAYRDEHLVNIKKKYFGNSFPKMIAHFAKKEKLTNAEIEELKRIIESQKP